MVCCDIRNTASNLFQFAAHDVTTTSLSFSPRVRGLLATSSIDKTVKVWDVSSVHSSSDASSTARPQLVAYKSMNVGKLLAMQFYGDDPFVLATGGDKGMVAVWECDELSAIESHFNGRIVAAQDGNNNGNSNNSSINYNDQSNSNAVLHEDVSMAVAQDNNISSSNITKSDDKKKKKKSKK